MRLKCSRFRVEPFSLNHLDYLEPDGHQLIGHKALIDLRDSGGDLNELLRRGFTGFFGDRPSVCAGFIEMWPTRACSWSVLDKSVNGSMMIPVHKAVMSAINSYQPKIFKRLEMSVLRSFRPGHKWARMLGFVPEGVMHHYDQWGRDYTLYARVRR